MRQLKAEGWMHHLGRHSVACFLTRGQLYISWERVSGLFCANFHSCVLTSASDDQGSEIFDKLLVDWDPSVNSGNW
jgi:cryptochrome